MSDTKIVSGIQAFELEDALPVVVCEEDPSDYVCPFYFLAPTAIVHRETGELNLRIFGLKIELHPNTSDADVKRYRDVATQAIHRKIAEECPTETYQVKFRISEIAPGLVLKESK